MRIFKSEFGVAESKVVGMRRAVRAPVPMRGRALVLVARLCMLSFAACGDNDHVSAPAEAPDVLTVHAGVALRPINYNLIGIHSRDDARTVAAAYDDVAPRTFRHVMSRHDFLHYDCESRTVDRASLDYFDAWLDAVYAEGAEPILSLSYVPECAARDGQPKGPPTDLVVYRQFLDALLRGLVTDRVRAGKRPLSRFELWNEPDIPVEAQAEGSGHGYVGTLDEYVAANLPSLAAALLTVQQESGVRLRVGTPAAFSPWPFAPRYGVDLADMLVRINGYDARQAAGLVRAANQAFQTPHVPEPAAVRIMTYGGVTWPRRVIDESARLGLEIAFVSVHLYPNTPLSGAAPPGTAEPALLRGRNPLASPEDFSALASLWSAEFPGKELVVSEWSLSSGSEWRHATCEGAAFNAAALSVMQGTAIDRAVFLGRPPGPADAAFRTWAALPATEVETVLPQGIANVWVTAATDADRTTVLASQWHTKLTDATDLRLPVVIDGLDNGAYVLQTEWIGAGHATAPGSSQVPVHVSGGRLRLPEPVTLAGQSVLRVDLRRSTAPPLPPLTLATATGPEARCLPESAPTPVTP